MPKKTLQNAASRLKTALITVVSKTPFRYQTFGNEVEPFVVDEMIKVLRRANLIKNHRDYHVAKDKNEFPDFTLRSTIPNLAIEIKSGNHSKLEGGRWKQTKNSNNDMGTLNKWPLKLKTFGAENIYYVFIEYDSSGGFIRILDVKIQPFYKFLALNSDGLLRYREKDGNLRPKDFNAPSQIQSAKEFLDLVESTINYRSKRIIQKHLRNISREDRASLLEN